MSAKPSLTTSPKSAFVSLLLCFFLGCLGAHRFYLGKIKTGILMLVTFGGLGVWTLIDLIRIDCAEFCDAEGRVLAFGEAGNSSGGLFMRILALLLAAIGMFIPLAAIVIMMGTGGLVSPVEDQLEAIRLGKMEQAYSYTSSGFQEETKIDTFIAFVDSYPVIKNNTKIKIKSREMDKNQGYLQGTIYDKNGGSLDIEYQMIYEGDNWKILGLRVNPTKEQAEAARRLEEKQVAEENSKSEDVAKVEEKSTANLTYTDKIGKYSISYPDNWIYENSDQSSVMFSGKKGSAAYASTVTIQVLPMKKSGGIYKNAKEIVADLKKQIIDKTQDVKFEREGDAELPTDTKAFKGYFFEVSYTYRGVPIKKMQFIIVNPSGTTGYSWGYTTDAARYDIDLPIAKAMYESWSIKK